MLIINRTRHLFCLALGSLTGLLFSNGVSALEVDREVVPRITLAGRVISTGDAKNLDSSPDDETEFNLEDSAVLLRFDKRIYSDNGVAGAVVGFKEDEDGAQQFQQLHAFFWNRDFRVTLGRTRLPNMVIEVPTLRDDDLEAYSRVGTVSSNEDFDQTYGELLSFDWFINQKIQSFNVWAGSRGNGDEAEFAAASDGIDSYGVGYVYEQPEDLGLVKRIRRAGVSIQRQEVNDGIEKEWVNSLIAGFEINLNTDPSKNWALTTQAIINNGIDFVLDLSTIASQSQADSRAIVSSVRYTARPRLLTRWHAALSVAYKDYSDNSDASQWSVAPNVVYTLGQGVNLLGQVIYTDYDDGLFDGGRDLLFQVGISFSLESVFNDQIGERDSIMNLEHGYIQ